MSLPNRRSIRLKGYDYSQAGLYFITICCHDRIHRFGNIADGKMILNEAGKIATAEWESLKDRFHNIKQGAFVVMPNHIHFIIIITNPGMATARVAATSTDYPIRARLAPDRKTDDGESVRAGLAPAYDGNSDIVRAELASAYDGNGDIVRAGFTPALDGKDDREGRPDEYNGVGNDGDRKGRPNESKYPENNPIGARLAPDRKTDDGDIVRAELAPAHDGDGESVRAGFTPALDGKDDREGRPDEYKGVGKESDREGRPNESKYPENNPIGARLAPDRKTDDGESVRARLAPAHDGDGDIVRAELASAQIETDDREGRPDEYNGVGNDGDRKGRPNESDRKITLGEIVGAYKSLVFNNCLKLAKDRGEYLGKFWQRDYYENIIRNDEAFIKISEYIINNPAKWRDDKFYNK